MRLITVCATILMLLAAQPAISDLSPGQLKLVKRYAKTLEKSRKAGERRDAAYELGKLEGAEVVQPLTGALSDPDAGVRRQAADSLWRVSEVAAPAEQALRAVLDDPSPGVRVRAAAALEALGVPEGELVVAREAGLDAERLRDRILASRDLVGFVAGPRLVPPILEVAAAEADTRAYDLGSKFLDPVKVLERLVRTGKQDFVEPVLDDVRAGNPGRRWLLKGLAGLDPKPQGWTAVLVTQLSSQRAGDRALALELLRERNTEPTGVEQWIEPVMAVADDPELRDGAIYTLRRAGGFAAPASAKLAGYVSADPDESVRQHAAEALAHIGDRTQAFPSDVLREVAVTSLPALCKAAVEDPDDDVRGAALSALGTLRVSSDEVVSTFLEAAKNDSDQRNRRRALQKIRDLGTDAQAAIPELELIIASDPTTRPTAMQALSFVKENPPDFSLDVATGPSGGGSEQALRELRAAGTDFSIYEFYQALSNVKVEKVRLFLEAGMSANERMDDVGMLPLHLVYFGTGGCNLQTRPTSQATLEVSRLLLGEGADPNAVDDRGNNVLKLAVLKCDAEVIRLLLEAGADMNAKDMNGMTPFELTLWSGTDAADALLEAGFRLPADKVASYREAYKDNAKALELLARAEGKAPNPWFFAERAYPLGHIPIESWRRAQTQAAEAALRAAEGVPAPVWTARGPVNVGGRITDMAVDPGNADIVYAGAAEGGVFRSYDGGQSWTPVFDEMPTLSIGALAIDPNNSNVIYAGTGEVNPGGGSVAYGGAGLFRSSDQGDTWSLVGLEDSGSIGRIVVDFGNSQRIFVAATGMLWQGNPERGVYRTTDGGTTWEQVLYVNDTTGCVDLIQRPDNPDVILAAMWQRLRQPEVYDYGGPGCAVYISTDGGDTWSLVGGGLPAPSADGGRIGLSLCASQPNVMHAVYADRVGYFDGLYRSVDGGTTWARTTDTVLDQNDVFASYGWWFGNVRTHPVDPNTIYVLGLDFWKSTDGGASYYNASDDMHVDHHGLDFGPGADPVVYNGNDGGVYRSADGGETWTKLPDLPLTQVYRLALDASNPNALYLGAQDNSTCRTLTGATDDWEVLYGGDGMQPLIHPLSSSMIWAQAQYGNIGFSSDGGTVWLAATVGIPAGDRKGWNSPLIQDPADPDLRYFGTSMVYRSTGDRTWVAISPDLTGGPYQDQPGQVRGTLTTLAVSELDTTVLWAGSDDGFVHVSADGGMAWTDVSTSLPERWVTSVRTDPFDRETAYVTISGFRWTEPLPHVFMTTDLGATWQAIAGNLPEAPVNDLLADPFTSGRYFVATDVGVFETVDRGAVWTMLGPDLPNVVVNSLILDRATRTLTVGTYGRSLFSADVASDLIFYDGFESGGASGWSSAVP